MPVGPEFQDPDPRSNQKPYFVSAAPYPLTVQTFTSTNSVLFSVTVGDPNINDVLYVQWVSNYPDYINSMATNLVKSDMSGDRSTDPNDNVMFMGSFSCKDFKMAPANSLAFIVSDRPFLDATEAAAFDPAHRYNFDNEMPPQRILTMLGWPVIGCQ